MEWLHLFQKRSDLIRSGSKCTLLLETKSLSLRFGAASSPHRGAKSRKPFSKTWSMIFSAAQLCCGALLFCLNPSDSLRSSAPLVGEPLAKPFTLRGLPRPLLLGATATTAASGGNREELLGPRPAGCERQRSRRWEPQPGFHKEKPLSALGHPGTGQLFTKPSIPGT